MDYEKTIRGLLAESMARSVSLRSNCTCDSDYVKRTVSLSSVVTRRCNCGASWSGDRLYIMQAAEVGLYKIGRSCDPAARLVAAASHSPVSVTMFAVGTPGTGLAERDMHNLFDGRRVRGEWFRLASDEALTVRRALDSVGDDRNG